MTWLSSMGGRLLVPPLTTDAFNEKTTPPPDCIRLLAVAESCEAIHEASTPEKASFCFLCKTLIHFLFSTTSIEEYLGLAAQLWTDIAHQYSDPRPPNNQY